MHRELRKFYFVSCFQKYSNPFERQLGLLGAVKLKLGASVVACPPKTDPFAVLGFGSKPDD